LVAVVVAADDVDAVVQGEGAGTVAELRGGAVADGGPGGPGVVRNVVLVHHREIAGVVPAERVHLVERGHGRHGMVVHPAGHVGPGGDRTCAVVGDGVELVAEVAVAAGVSAGHIDLVAARGGLDVVPVARCGDVQLDPAVRGNR